MRMRPGFARFRRAPRRASRRALVVVGIAALAAVALVGGQAHAGGGTVLTYEDLNVPAGGRVTLNSQYAAQGVTFNDVSAIDYSQPPFPPGFAHSGTVAIEQCFAVEFCTAPITASFTAGQQAVKVWVGLSFATPQPIGVRLTAFDAGHVAVATSDVTLPANAAPTPVQTPLEVSVASPTIRSVEVSVPGGYTNGLVVDDLELSVPGPPPDCNAPAPPLVDLFQPQDGLTVHNNEFLLSGSVLTVGAPIQSATIVNHGQQGDRTAILYPTLVGPNGGTFGPVRFNGLLLPGGNKLTVTATNCRGTTASRTVIVNWNPVPPGASFRQLGLEVSQAVQTPSNSVPLVAAAGNSFKRTFVRVYLGLEGAQRISGVTGTLTARRPDGSFPGGPLSIRSLNTVTVNGGATLETTRTALATSLNFELPQQWLTAGQLHLQLDHLEIEGAQSTLPCIGCDNAAPPPPFGPGGPAFIRFRTVPPVRIVLVGVPYMSGTQLHTPRQRDFDMLASWLRRAYPSSDIQVTQASLAALRARPESCDDVNTLLAQFSATQAVAAQTRFYGLIADGGGFVRGCAEIGGNVGSGPAGSLFENGHWDVDGSYADWYGGHEIAHMYGRLHPSAGADCGQSSDDDDYPYVGGLIGTHVFDVQGLDVGDAALSLGLSLNDWRAAWSDMMTYCDRQWISDYTYRAILERLCSEDPNNCPNQRLGGLQMRGVDVDGGPARGPAISITGTLTLSTGRVVLDPLWARPGLVLTQRPGGGDYAIEMRGAGGRVLARHPFQPRELSDPPTEARAIAAIREVVPFPARTRQIVVMHKGDALASVRVSANAPKVRLLSPNGGKTLRKWVKVRWRSTDADRNPRWYTVLYSPDGEHTIPLATGLRRTSLRVDTTTLPGGAGARFEVVASDGVRTGSDRSDRTFRVPVKAPWVSVIAPAAGLEVVAGTSITFVGAATDLQDGQLSAAQLAWSSSLQGALGTGPSITISLLPGKHVIALTATNRAGESAVAHVTVEVLPVPPVVVATIVP